MGSESLYTVDEEGNIVIAQDGIYDFYFKADTQLLYFETGTTESTPNVEITSTEVTNAWPGNKMQAVEGKDGWYSITIRGKAEKIIFNEGTGDDNDKTADLTIDFDNIYYKDGKWQSVLNEINDQYIFKEKNNEKNICSNNDVDHRIYNVPVCDGLYTCRRRRRIGRI